MSAGGDAEAADHEERGKEADEDRGKTSARAGNEIYHHGKTFKEKRFAR